ncbi:MAG: enoyl-CoA hydratase-related protein [Acidimicrobiia bacterium]|nr:enoyl-CoA hydratase-related protein [Acidimicrobiia bacterium]
MESIEGLRYEVAGGVATITLDRPDKLNAIRWNMVFGLTKAVREAGEDPAARVIVITGEGRAFSSGDDIVGGMGDEVAMDGRSRIARAHQRGPHYELIKALLSTPKPIVAALNGRCHGAGFVIALGCDFRVARDDVLIGDIRSGKAIFANQGVGLMLPHLIGAARAMDLLMTGRVIDAAEAERYGLLARVWPAHAWEAELAGFVGELAAGPTRVYAAWKASVNRAVLEQLDAYTDHENLLNLSLLGCEDTMEGVKAFAERREPRFTGR